MTARRAAHERFACDLDVELEAGRVRTTGGARDLNDLALCCTVGASIDPGTRVQAHLRLVLEWGSSQALTVPGQVAWSTASEGRHQIGVVFLDVSAETRQRLQVLLKILNGQISLPAPGK